MVGQLYHPDISDFMHPPTSKKTKTILILIHKLQTHYIRGAFVVCMNLMYF